MKPFKVSSLPANAFDKYPNASAFLGYLSFVRDTELEAYLRIHVTEGIPFIFFSNPLLYEMVRGWLSGELGIHAKDVTLIGSARIGFSMAPVPDFGVPYGKTSDLDFTIVSAKLFQGLGEAFHCWKSEFENGLVKPKNVREKRFWEENLRRIPDNLDHGFVDTYKIPNRYASVQGVNSVLWQLSEKLKATENCSDMWKVSVRIYSDWSAFSRQFMTNFRHAIASVDDNHKNLLTVRSAIR